MVGSFGEVVGCGEVVGIVDHHCLNCFHKITNLEESVNQ
jgi:hypothetical protein